MPLPSHSNLAFLKQEHQKHLGLIGSSTDLDFIPEDEELGVDISSIQLDSTGHPIRESIDLDLEYEEGYEEPLVPKFDISAVSDEPERFIDPEDFNSVLTTTRDLALSTSPEEYASKLSEIKDKSREVGLTTSMRMSYETAREYDSLGVLYHQLMRLEADGLDTSEIEDKIEQSEATVEKYQQYVQHDNWLEHSLVAGAGIVGNIVDMTKGGFKRLPEASSLALLAMLIPGAGPQAAKTAMGIGFRVGVAEEMYKIASGLAYKELSSLVDEEGNKIDETLARRIAYGTGVLIAATEVVQMSLLGKFIPHGQGIVAKNIAKVMSSFDLKREAYSKIMAVALPKAALKIVESKSLKGTALRFSGKVTTLSLTEGSLEATQEGIQIAADALGVVLSKELEIAEFDEFKVTEMVDRVKGAFVEASLGTAALGGFGGGGIRAMKKSAEATNNWALNRLYPERKLTGKAKDTYNAYIKIKNSYLGERDIQLLHAKNSLKEFTAVIQNAAKTDPNRSTTKLSSSKFASFVDSAIYIYADGQQDLQRYNEIYKKASEEIKSEEGLQILTQEHFDILHKSRNLTNDQKKIANTIAKRYEQLGKMAGDQGLIRSMLDSYIARAWDLDTKAGRTLASTFFTKSRHAKERAFPLILDGWIKGLTLKSNSAAVNLYTYESSIVQIARQAQLMETMKQAKIQTPEGSRALFLNQRYPGYEEVFLPGRMVEVESTQSLEGEAENGLVYTEQRVYAPTAVAKDLNNIFGKSKLDVIGIRAITNFNTLIKHVLLSTGFFHTWAFIRSYMLGGTLSAEGKGVYKTLSNINPMTAYKEGKELIANSSEVIQQGVRNGLTLQVDADLLNQYNRRSNMMSRLMDKNKVSLEVKYQILRANDWWTGWLFGSFGMGLKAKAYQLEMLHELQAPKQLDAEGREIYEDTDIIARRVASLINDDFGGLHLERIGRNPTLQHILQLTLLAPDWTESNIRSAAKVFSGQKENPKAVRQLHRRFWARIVVKSMVASFFMNCAVSLLSSEEEEKLNSLDKIYADALKRTERLASGDTTALMPDITPVYEALFGSSKGKRKYFNLIGHFVDPLKFVTAPTTSFRHKGSPLFTASFEAITGENWSGERFTTLPELMTSFGQLDPELTTRKYLNYRDPVVYKWTVVSYMLEQILGAMPIQLQTLSSWTSGEADGFTTAIETIGLDIKSRKIKTRRRRP